MNLTLISPRLAFQKGDLLGSGVPYWPVELATFAQHLIELRHSVRVLDLFGRNPKVLEERSDHYLQGMPISSSAFGEESFKSAQVFVVYAISFMSHAEILDIIAWLKTHHPETKILVLENSQAVTAYSAEEMAPEFFKAGADFVLCGEPYHNWNEIEQLLSRKPGSSLPSNLLTVQSPRLQQKRITQKNYHYPVPAWDMFHLQGYWSLPYSHGPKTSRFLPILTSRGCPYSCDFCVVPGTNDRLWRGNSPESVVDEIIFLRDKFQVFDFQVEDLNPTVQHLRWERICELLIEKKVGIRFYFVSGTKAETIHVEKVPLFARAGCRYVSISPESGSIELMKKIGKRFDQAHGLQLVQACRQNGIRTQACFLVGHPEETHGDFELTRKYLTQLLKSGLDETAIFIVSPFAGSKLHSQQKVALSNEKALKSFSPKGRSDFEEVALRRRQLIRTFFLWKILVRGDLFVQGLRGILGKPQTKMENLPWRFLFIQSLILRSKLSHKNAEIQ